ncbi:FAD-dependent oxidoreductase [Candidatus Parcubacteria bacterium]|nr:FAD-dependent oxidoreductase [Candidatus Parcubacteria bacterium]
MMYDLAIIGGGPGGVAAGVYASRKRLKTLFITESFGGQSIVSAGIENWIGTVNISGEDLAKSLEAHLRAYAGDMVDIKTGLRVASVEKKGETFLITDSKGGSYEAKAVLVTTGSTRRRLEIPGADQFEHKGVTYCASCDGPLFADMDTVVIGGGNAAFETAAQLLAYTKSVTLLNRSAEFRADPVTVKKVLENPKMHAVLNAEPLSIQGENFISGLTYKDRESGENKELAVQGVFVEIGLLPSTDFMKDVVAKNPIGQIIVDPRTQRASVPGIWAAGDCTDGLYHQNNIAAGDAVKALEDIYLYLHA